MGGLSQSSHNDNSVTGSLSDTVGVVVTETVGMNTYMFFVSGTWAGTGRFEGTSDGDSPSPTWRLLTYVDNSNTTAATFTTNTNGLLNCAGFTHVRCRLTAYTSGTLTLISNTGVGLGTLQPYNSNAAALKSAVRSDILPLTGSAAALNADAVASTDLGGYQSASIQVTGTWVGTLSFQGSNDGTTFFDAFVTDVQNPFAAPQRSTTTNGLFFLSLEFRYLRVRMTAYTSGTVSTVTVVDTLTAETTLSSVLNGVLTDHSGMTSATPSTSTQVMAANSSRRYLMVQNHDTAAIIWINFTTTAAATQPSIEIGPKQAFEFDGGFVSTEVVNILSTTASVKYTAKEA